MSPSSLRLGIVVLSALTGLIHLVVLNLRYLAAGQAVNVPFTLNGLGFLAFAVATVWLPPFLAGREALVRWAFIGFTAVTIVAWIVLGDMGDILGWITKAIEVALIALLLWQGRRAAV